MVFYTAHSSTDSATSEHPEHCSNVVDISQSLYPNEVDLLKHGLTFCPTNNAVNEYELHKDITEFSRRMRIKEFFFERPDVGKHDKDSLRPPRTWTPEAEQCPDLDLYIKLISNDILESRRQCRKHKNLSPAEDKILKNSRKERIL